MIEALQVLADLSFALDLRVCMMRFKWVALTPRRFKFGAMVLDRVSEVAQDVRELALARVERLEDEDTAVHVAPPPKGSN